MWNFYVFNVKFSAVYWCIFPRELNCLAVILGVHWLLLFLSCADRLASFILLLWMCTRLGLPGWLSHWAKENKIPLFWQMRPHLWFSPQHKQHNMNRLWKWEEGLSFQSRWIWHHCHNSLRPGFPWALFITGCIYVYREGVTSSLSIFQWAPGIVCYRAVLHGQLDISQTILW